MSNFGISDTGFTLKRLADILNDMSTALGSITDPVTGEMLTPELLDENDPLVQMTNSFSDGLALAWEQLQLAYNQFNPNAAGGVSLSSLVQLNGITRQSGSYSTVQLTLSGTPNYAIPAGQQVSPLDDSSIWNLPAFTFDGSGDATITATCSVVGAISADIGTLVKIVTPQAGWSTTTNLIAATIGTAEESDTALRGRRSNSTSALAVAIIESVYSSLIGLAGVTSVYAYQNITNSTDGNSVPSKNIAVIIQGGVDADIANILWLKASGFPQYGTTTVNITDIQGILYPMKFSRPTPVNIYIAVSVRVTDATKWPSNGDDLIIASIMDYVTTGLTSLGQVSGIVAKSWGIGNDVFGSDFFPPVASVPGAQILSLFVGTSSSPTGTSVTVAWNAIAAFDASRITVTVS